MLKSSVIIPTYNRAQVIQRAVDSVLSQTFRDFELLIIDDGSTDDSLNVLQSLAHNDKRMRVVTQSNQGAGPARNRGLDIARGEYIAFLDADDTWDVKNIEKLHKTLALAGVFLCLIKMKGNESWKKKTLKRWF